MSVKYITNDISRTNLNLYTKKCLKTSDSLKETKTITELCLHYIEDQQQKCTRLKFPDMPETKISYDASKVLIITKVQGKQNYAHLEEANFQHTYPQVIKNVTVQKLQIPTN